MVDVDVVDRLLSNNPENRFSFTNTLFLMVL